MRDLEHPDITEALRTGYPVQQMWDDDPGYDEDEAYEEARDRRAFGED